MSAFCRIAGILILAGVFVSPITMRGQGEESSSGASTVPASGLSDQQKMGEALFLQNCPLCHVGSSQKKRMGIPTPSLKGLFKKPISEDGVRNLILKGIPGAMPGFQYDLEPKEINSIVAYLKTL